MIYFDKRQTAIILNGRTEGFWEFMNELSPDNTTCETLFENADYEYNALEMIIEEDAGAETPEGVEGVSFDDEPVSLPVKIDRKPPTQRPSW